MPPMARFGKQRKGRDEPKEEIREWRGGRPRRPIDARRHDVVRDQPAERRLGLLHAHARSHQVEQRWVDAHETVE